MPPLEDPSIDGCRLNKHATQFGVVAIGCIAKPAESLGEIHLVLREQDVNAEAVVFGELGVQVVELPQRLDAVVAEVEEEPAKRQLAGVVTEVAEAVVARARPTLTTKWADRPPDGAHTANVKVDGEPLTVALARV